MAQSLTKRGNGDEVRPVRVRIYYDIIEKMRETFTGRGEVDRLVFYKSELGESGPTYTALKEMLFLA